MMIVAICAFFLVVNVVVVAAAADVDLDGRKAFWVTRDRLAINHIAFATYGLRSCVDCVPDFTHGNEREYPLTFVRFLSSTAYPKFPNLNGDYVEVAFPSANVSAVPDILRGGISLVQRDGSTGAVVQLTGIQIQGVLDDLFANDDVPLGVTFDDNDGTLSVAVWAPTAQDVSLDILDTNDNHNDNDNNDIVLPMDFNASTGVWRVAGLPRAEFEDRYYSFVIVVFVPETGRVETNVVTDPYAVSLSMESLRSQMLDLNSAKWKPPGWDSLRKPSLAAPEDIILYELHVREFSANDSSVPPAMRGKYGAFTLEDSNGVQHLRALAAAGFTHVHLLPINDCGTIHEDPSVRVEPDTGLLASYPGDSARQQEIIGELRQIDSWNWCYDPFHYGVPEGSYAQDGNVDGGARVLEFRTLVQALNEVVGLRVVVDVVYNHVTQAGNFGSKSVLDKVVPGYYKRYDNNGVLQQQTCCPDTATEFAMMERLMRDTLVRWTSAYRVDGFRFDLMGFHTVDNLLGVRDTLSSLRSDIYLYGEGWAFGSLQAKGFTIASQFNMAGTGVGTFNDRIRDALHGGSREDTTEIRTQGFINGLSYDWNGYYYGARYRDDLLRKQDIIKIGMAGNLQNFVFVDRFGNANSGIGYEGTGYALDPQEAVQYHSSHDDQNLWDLTAYKAPQAVSASDRSRIQNLGIAIVMLSQGVPFFAAGEELLRSKSLDRNTYDSGDWFNTLDYTRQDNHFPAGLPPDWGNEERWAIAEEILRLPIAPSSADISRTFDHICEFAAIRKSSPLFRLRTEADILARLRFYNNGPDQISGVIALYIHDDASPVVVVANADKFPRNITISDTDVTRRSWTLHPILAASSDPVVRGSIATPGGVFALPYRTTAVFVVSSSLLIN